MRGSYFDRPLEYRLEVEGESWNQGDTISGTLQLCNRGDESTKESTCYVAVAYAQLKDVRSGSSVPWEILNTQKLGKKKALAAGSDMTVPWQLELGSDCPITDKSGTLFLLYGNDQEYQQIGKIDLQVGIMPILQSFLQTFETQFKFRQKYAKYRKGAIEVKLDSPETPEYAKLKQTLCHLRIHEGVLETRYDFKTESLGREGHQLGVKKERKKVAHDFPPEDYLLPGGFPNRKVFQQLIDEALELVRSPFVRG